MRLAISRQGYTSAVDALVSGNQFAAWSALRLCERLGGFAGMAGDDPTATEFASSYDAAAAASVEALESTVGALGALGRLVEASITNHALADRRSTLPGWARSVVGPPTVADRAVGVLLPAPPSSLGADPGGPSGPAGMVLDLLQDVFWPNADTDRVRAAGACWTAASESVDLLTADCDSAVSALDGEQSPEIPIAIAVVSDVRGRIGDLSAQLAALGTACSEYADHVESKRSELLSLLEDLVVELGITAVLGGIGTFLSGGAAGGIATGVGATRLASAAGRARGILDSLRILAGGTALGVRPVAVTAGEVTAQTARINSARVLLTEAGESGGAGEGVHAWLARQANAGGHIWQRHVAKTNAELRSRLLSDPKITAASTFPDKATAHRAVSDLLRTERHSIDKWLAGDGGTLPVQGTLDYPVGQNDGSLRRGVGCQVDPGFADPGRRPTRRLSDPYRLPDQRMTE